MIHRGDVEFALENPEAAFDIGQGFIAVDDLGGRQILDVGHQDQFAVKELRARLGFGVDSVSKQGGVEVQAHDPGQTGVDDGGVELQGGAFIGELAAFEPFPLVLSLEFLRPDLALCEYLGQAGRTFSRLGSGGEGIVGDDQAPLLPGGLAHPIAGFRIGRRRREVQRGYGIGQFRIAPCRHRQNVLQAGGPRNRQGFQRRYIVQRQEASIRDQDHPLDGIALQ